MYLPVNKFNTFQFIINIINVSCCCCFKTWLKLFETDDENFLKVTSLSLITNEYGLKLNADDPDKYRTGLVSNKRFHWYRTHNI